MATQGQRRREALAAIRKLRQIWRQVDTAGERIERELDRLIRRKTLISPDSLSNLSKLIDTEWALMQNLQRGYASTWEIIRFIPV